MSQAPHPSLRSYLTPSPPWCLVLAQAGVGLGARAVAAYGEMGSCLACSGQSGGWYWGRERRGYGVKQAGVRRQAYSGRPAHQSIDPHPSTLLPSGMAQSRSPNSPYLGYFICDPRVRNTCSHLVVRRITRINTCTVLLTEPGTQRTLSIAAIF